MEILIGLSVAWSIFMLVLLGRLFPDGLTKEECREGWSYWISGELLILVAYIVFG